LEPYFNDYRDACSKVIRELANGSSPSPAPIRPRILRRPHRTEALRYEDVRKAHEPLHPLIAPLGGTRSRLGQGDLRQPLQAGLAAVEVRHDAVRCCRTSYRTTKLANPICYESMESAKPSVHRPAILLPHLPAQAVVDRLAVDPQHGCGGFDVASAFQRLKDDLVGHRLQVAELQGDRLVRDVFRLRRISRFTVCRAAAAATGTATPLFSLALSVNTSREYLQLLQLAFVVRHAEEQSPN
jgi:hypothetical protein